MMTDAYKYRIEITKRGLRSWAEAEIKKYQGVEMGMTEAALAPQHALWVLDHITELEEQMAFIKKDADRAVTAAAEKMWEEINDASELQERLEKVQNQLDITKNKLATQIARADKQHHRAIDAEKDSDMWMRLADEHMEVKNYLTLRVMELEKDLKAALEKFPTTFKIDEDTKKVAELEGLIKEIRTRCEADDNLAHLLVLLDKNR